MSLYLFISPVSVVPVMLSLSRSLSFSLYFSLSLPPSLSLIFLCLSFSLFLSISLSLNKITLHKTQMPIFLNLDLDLSCRTPCYFPARYVSTWIRLNNTRMRKCGQRWSMRISKRTSLLYRKVYTT